MPSIPQSLAKLRGQALSVARRMDWARGLRAATALSTPLLIADFTGLTHLGWTALGGIEAIVSDAGGPYRSRLARLSLVSFAGSFAIFLGTLIGNDLRLAVPITLLFCFVWTYSTVLGQPFASAGLLIQVIYICGVGEPSPSMREALTRGAFLLAGGAWATLLSLIFWPLDPYRPARAAVADCFRALGVYLENTARMQSAQHSADDWHRANRKHKVELRQLIERAWEAVAGVRAQTAAETQPGRQLVVLVETTDLILQRAVALAEHAEAATPIRNPTPCTQAGLGFSSIIQLAAACESVASLLVRRTLLKVDATALRSSLGQYPTSLAFCLPQNDPDGHFLARQLIEVASNLDTAVETACLLRQGSSTYPSAPSRPNPEPLKAAPPARDLPSAWDRLSANWCRSSLSFRHAIRVALVCSFDLCLTEQRHLGHGYWLIITSLIVLQPHVSGTMQKGMQRVAGTVTGGIFAAALALVLHTQLATGVALIPLAVLALALLPVNYAAYAFFVTPAFVLAFLRHTGDWQLAFIRIGNTIAGAAVAIAAMTVLFPAYERERVAGYLTTSLVANRTYLERVMACWHTGCVDMKALALARRSTGLAHNDMEESVERVLAENWARKASSEALIAFAAYLHRFSQSVTGLVALPGYTDWKSSPRVQDRLVALHGRLLWLEQCLHSSHRCEPPSWTDLLASASDSPSPELLTPGERQLVRLERQILVMARHLPKIREGISAQSA